MLGTLAKWLRILGYDTVYDPDLDDHQLVRLARAQDRVLLTRDRELAMRRGVRVLSVKSEDLDEQIRQVLADLELETDQSYSRCPICNELLQALDREAARERVPPYVAQTRKTFKSCPRCRRVYWRGTHRRRMDEQLARFRPHGTLPAVEELTGPNSTNGG
jgi:uncharacterized protein with PIN domain